MVFEFKDRKVVSVAAKEYYTISSRSHSHSHYNRKLEPAAIVIKKNEERESSSKLQEMRVGVSRFIRHEIEKENSRLFCSSLSLPFLFEIVTNPILFLPAYYL